MQPHNPIDHVVIIVKENHTFDNYLGRSRAQTAHNFPRRKTRLSAATRPTITGHGCSGPRTG